MILCICPNPAIDKLIDIEDFGLGQVNRIQNELSYPGGKGVHVALGLKEFGEEVMLLSIWGGDSGKWIKQKCEAHGIPCYGPEVEEESRTCLTIKSNNNSIETEILGTGPTIGKKEYNSFFKDYEKLLIKSNVVSMSGSWPTNSIGANYAPFIEKASQLKIKSFVDCSGKILTAALEKKPYAVHINHHEAHDIYRSENPTEIFSKLSTDCTIAAITYGAKGLHLSDGKEVIHALSKVKNVLSTVGSGDSLMAGLIVADQRNYNLPETAKLAAAAGAANCIRKELGMFYKADTERLFNNCDISIKQLH